MEEDQWRNEFVALDSPATVQTTTNSSPKPPKRKQIPWKWLIGAVILIAVLVTGLLLLRGHVNKKPSTANIGQVKTQEVDLGSLANVATPLKLDNTDKVVINGQLQTNQGLVINPTTEPVAAVLGQIYLDSKTGELRYYNGTSYQTLATTSSTSTGLTQAEVLALITGSATTLPQDLATTASPLFAGLKLSASNGNSALIQAAIGTNNVTFTLPTNGGTANQCLTTDGNGTLSFAACATGSGNAFLQGGNTFAAAAVLGTTDSNSLSIITNGATRLTISSTGNIGIGNTTPGNKLGVNSPTTADSLAQTVIATGAAANKGLVVQGVIFQTGNLFELQEYTGSTVLSVGSGGATTVRTATNSTSGFQVQNSSGTALLTADTTNGRLGVSNTSPQYKLDVNGDINIVGTSSLRIGGTIICTSSGCDSTSSSGFYIQNGNGVQSNANFAIQSANAGYVGGLIRAAASQTADIFELQVSNGTNVVSVGSSGNVLIQPYTNSTTGFQVQNAAGTSNTLVADTTNSRVGIGITPSYKLDVNGDVNIETSSSLRIGGTIICTSAGCSGAGGSGFYIQNGTGVQSSANFAIQSANATYVGGIIKGAASQSADLLQIQNSAGANLFNVTSTGAATLQNTTDSTSAFKVLDSAGTSNVLVVDTVNKRVGINEYPSGYALDVNGDVNLDNSGSLRINGNVVCSLTGCSASSGSGNYIQNGNGVQTNGNFAIQSANNGYVGGLIRGAAGQTADLLEIQNSSGANLFKVDASGYATFQNSANNSTAFNVNNSSGTSVFNVDTSSGTVNATNVSGNAFIGTTSNSSSYGVTGTQSAGVGGGVKGVGGGGYGVLGQSSSNASGFFQTTDTSNLNSVATLITKAQTSQVTADLFQAQTSAGVNLFTIGSSGAVLAKNSVDGTAAFSIQNAAGNNYLLVNTSAAQISLGNTGIASTIQIGNTTGAVAQTINIGNNSTAISTTTTTIGSSIGASSVTIQGGSTGVIVKSPTAGSTTAFQVQNAAGTGQLFNIDSANTVIKLNGSNSAQLQTWSTTTTIGSTTVASGVVSNGSYLYSIAGTVAGTTTNNVSYAGLNADGTIGAWTTNATAATGLTDAVTTTQYAKNYPGVAVYNGHIYVAGGFNNAGTSSQGVLYSKINSDGSVGSWRSADFTLNTAVGAAATVAYNGYLFVIGGSTSASSGSPGVPVVGNAVTTVQYAKINANGSLGAFSALSSNPLPAARVGGRATISNGILYFVGGQNGTNVSQDIYRTPLTTNYSLGTVTLGSWTTQSTILSAARAYLGIALLNGNIYAVGGGSTAGTSTTVGSQTVDYCPISSTGAISSCTQETNNLVSSSTNFGNVAVANGYLYVVGGNGLSSVQYASGPRTIVGGSLDLVNLAGGSITSESGGGSLTAGNTIIAGTLQVAASATFLQSASVAGNLNVGGQLAVKNIIDSTTAFTVQNAAGNNILIADTASSSILPGFGSGAVSTLRKTTVITNGSDDIASTNISMAIGTDHLPIISTYDNTTHKLLTIKCFNSECSSGTTITSHSSPISSSDTFGSNNSIAIGSDGLPIIGARDSTATKLVAVHCGTPDCSVSSNTYTASGVSSSGNTVNVLVPYNKVPMFFYEKSNNNIAYQTCTTIYCTALSSEVAGTSSDNDGVNPSAVLGNDNIPLIVHQGLTGDNHVSITKCADTSCTSLASATTNTITIAGRDIGDYTSIAITRSDGKPVIVTTDNTGTTSVIYYRCLDTQCATTTSPITIAATANYPAVAIGSDGLPLITYKLTNTSALQVLHCGNVTCTSGNTLTALSTNFQGAYSQTLIGDDNLPVITATATSTTLSVLHCVDVTCASPSADILTGGVSLGSVNVPYSALYVESINSNSKTAKFRLTTDGTFYSNTLKSDTNGNVSIQSSSTTAFLVQNPDTVTNLLSVDASTSGNSVNIGTSTSVSGFGFNSTVASLFRNASNSTSQFAIQNSSSSSLFNLDSSNNRLNLFSALSAISAPASLAAAVPAQNATPTVTPTGTTGATSYSYIVEAVTTIGNSAPSTAGTTSTGNATLSSTNYNALSWTAFTPLSGSTSYYKIYRSVGGVTTGLIGTTTSTTFNDTGYTANGTSVTAGGNLSASTAYFYKVTAIDSTGGESAASIEVTATTGVSTKTIALTWTTVSGATAYRIYRSTTTGTEVYLATTGATPFTDNGSITIGTGSAPSSGTAYTSTNNASSALQLVVGGNGTPTGQVYVSGTVPSAAIGTVATGSSPRIVRIQGKYAYVVNLTSGTMQVFDVSNPSRPILVGSVASGSQPIDLYIQGKYAYVINGTGVNTFTVIDVSTPSNPSVLSTSSTGINTLPRNIYVRGRYAYVTTFTSGTMQIWDVYNPSAPVMTSSINIGSNPRGIFIQGRYAYVTNSTSGTLQIIDINDPANPVSVSTTVTTAVPYAVTVQGRYAYVVSIAASSNFQVFDISNPNAVGSAVSTFSLVGSNPESVTVQGRYAYVVNNGNNTFQTVDISNPTNPFSVGSTATGSSPQWVTVQGRYAYVINNSANTLQIFDIGGEYAQQLEAGGAELGTLGVNGAATFGGDVSVQGGINVGASIQAGANLGVSGNTLLQGSLAVVGGVQGGLTISGISAPTTPTVTNGGTAGATTYSYTVTAVSATGGESTASSTGTTTTGNSTLSSTNYNIITWPAVTGAISYKVYRTAGGASQGLLSTTTSIIYNDVGSAGSGSAPTTNTTGSLNVTGNSLFKPTTDNANAFKIQNAAAAVTLLSVDTSGNGNIAINAAADTGVINIGTVFSTVVTIGKSGGTGTLAIYGNTTLTGTLAITGDTTINGHVLSGNSSGSTTFTAGAAACTSGTTTGSTGNDTSGKVTVNTGASGCTTGTMVTVNFANTYGSAPIVLLTPGDATTAGAALQYYATPAATNFILGTNNTTTINQVYIFYYHVIK